LVGHPPCADSDPDFCVFPYLYHGHLLVGGSFLDSTVINGCHISITPDVSSL
jgi:hypothetical protein